MTEKMHTHLTLFLASVLCLLLIGCVSRPTIWQKANTSIDEQRHALAQCRSFANSEAEREYVQDQTNSGSGVYGSQSPYQKNMGAYQHKKNTQGLLSRCMKLKGYRRAAAGN